MAAGAGAGTGSWQWRMGWSHEIVRVVRVAVVVAGRCDEIDRHGDTMRAPHYCVSTLQVDLLGMWWRGNEVPTVRSRWRLWRVWRGWRTHEPRTPRRRTSTQTQIQIRTIQTSADTMLLLPDGHTDTRTRTSRQTTHCSCSAPHNEGLFSLVASLSSSISHRYIALHRLLTGIRCRRNEVGSLATNNSLSLSSS